MPKYLFICFFVILCGCHYSNEPIKNDLGSTSDISIKENSLIGGGRWFAGKDIGAWYDLNLVIYFKNKSDIVKNLSARVEIGLLNNGAFDLARTRLLFDTNLLFEKVRIVEFTVDKNTKHDIAWTLPIGIGRYTYDWALPYAFRVTIYDESNNDSVVVMNELHGSSPNNRFRGVINTTKSSPDSLGLIDSPDDDDWKMTAPKGARIAPCFPNPINGLNPSTTFQFLISQENDSAYFTVNRTPSSIILTENIGKMSKGKYEYLAYLSGNSPGVYRLYYHLFRDGLEYISHGDVMIEN
jgi:hypothetical protein